MFLNRRKLLSSVAAMGAMMAVPGMARAEDESIWDILARNSRKADLNPDENTMKALAVIDTPEPILSFDTAYNIQNAMAYYQQVVAAGGWEAPTRQTFKLAIGKDGRAVIAHKSVWDCNWFQHVENSLDAVHVSFAHLWSRAGQFGSSVTASIPELSYSETSAGIRQVATRPNNNVRISDWTFPNNNHVVAPSPEKGDPWAHVSAWPVPVDDTRTMRFVLNAVEASDPAKIERLKQKYDLDYNPADHYDELFHRGVVSGVNEFGLLNAQDYVAVRGQGVVCDRSQENLSTSDAGIAFLRRIFLRELEAIRQGRPTKQWSRIEEAQHLPPPPVQAAE